MSTSAKHGVDAVHLPLDAAEDTPSGPPKRSKVIAYLAAIACIGCCALPLLIPLGLLTGAGVAAATTGLLVVSAVLFALAGLLWFAHHRRKSDHACSQGNCSC
ncbi:hypothetical protein [Lentzea sp. CC55]|uniref:hypothetical protein n=1 Tax=Lentzea sp. CC55 TaxID=2884909 RepID=UPI001F1CF2EC|nr:hypothetical protein [Lentzea sp. CC55]MCG8927374.1 hypothetical protein [Lentzea sp. CC55]